MYKIKSFRIGMYENEKGKIWKVMYTWYSNSLSQTGSGTLTFEIGVIYTTGSFNIIIFLCIKEHIH